MNKPIRTEENLTTAKSLADSDKDSFGFAFETGDEFSGTPLEFEEYSRDLLEDLEEVCYMTGIFNRFSPNYLACCGLLEKIVIRLGSCCVTKAVLEQKGFTFDSLKALSAEALYSCISFNFRKCHAAVKEARSKNIIDFKLLDMECRFYNLSERLRSTAEKTAQIREEKIKADRLLERAQIFKQTALSLPGKRCGSLPSADRKPYAFPVLGSVAREMIRKDLPNKNPSFQYETFDAKPFSLLPLNAVWDGLDKRKQQKGAADMPEYPSSEYMMNDEEEQFMTDIWNRCEGKSGYPELKAAVPSDKVRKELREKRKKKKR